MGAQGTRLRVLQLRLRMRVQFKNPVTGEEHLANVDLPNGFIWKLGECGQGTFTASANGLSVGATNSNWIYYGFDWSNAS
jgi:hypothetical protein